MILKIEQDFSIQLIRPGIGQQFGSTMPKKI